MLRAPSVRPRDTSRRDVTRSRTGGETVLSNGAGGQQPVLVTVPSGQVVWLNVTPVRFAQERFALVRFASVRFALVRFALLRFR